MDKHRRSWIWIVAAVLLLPALYVLSFGPVCWINERTDAGSRWISALYAPIIRLANRSTQFELIALWYAGLGAREGSTPGFDSGELGWWTTIPEHGPTLLIEMLDNFNFELGSQSSGTPQTIDSRQNGTDRARSENGGNESTGNGE